MILYRDWMSMESIIGTDMERRSGKTGFVRMNVFLFSIIDPPRVSIWYRQTNKKAIGLFEY